MPQRKSTLGDRLTYNISLLIRLALLFVGFYALFNGRWSVVVAAVGTLVLSYIPQLLASQAKVKLPLQFQLIIIAFLYASIFLGEVGDYYEKFWWWDVFLHAGSAFAFGFAGFLALFLLYARHKLTASPLLLGIFTFTFGLAIGALWEIFEYTMDQTFGLNMQKNGLRDTMWDLIVDGAGSGTAGIIGYIYLRYNIHDPFDFMIRWFLRENPQFITRKNIRTKFDK